MILRKVKKGKVLKQTFKIKVPYKASLKLFLTEEEMFIQYFKDVEEENKKLQDMKERISKFQEKLRGAEDRNID